LITETPRSARSREKVDGTPHAFYEGMEDQLDPVTSRIIGCAITLHRFLGPGLLESVYHTGLAIEMGHAQIPLFDAQVLTYLRLTGLRTGLLLNFGRPVLRDGIKRFRL